jgi:D-alanyl-D-alanine carboxypeptidase/D-alanyl-D-alanine-endopeptidase (penicillin-binding protein 4)
MKLKYIVFSLLVLSLPLFAGNPVDDLLNNKLLENANVSLLVKDLNTGQVVCQSRSGNLSIPASTMKLVTTSVALELLGPDFRFETKLEIDGTVNKDSTLMGNLYIRGGGDPTLGSEKLGKKDFFTEWMAAVKALGINKIKGRIIADESIFEQQVINPKWTWEDMGNYYAPGIHGISYLDNTFRLIFKSGEIGTTPEILRTEPEIPGLEIDNHLLSSSIDYDNAYFYGAPYSYDRSIYGEIPANKKEFIVKGDIPNPALLLAQHFHTYLSDNGININDFPIVLSQQSNQRKTIYIHYSPTLREIITETNIKSNNLFAEYIFKFIGTINSKIGSTNQAIENIRSYWRMKGLPVDQLIQFDGCGLSPSDAVSANFFVELLIYMKTKSKYADDFYHSLPLSGESGTLSKFLIDTPLSGKVHAKSGTIQNVKSYAGYIELKNRTLVFALLVNYANGPSKAVVKKMEEFFLQLSESNNQ